MSGDPIQNLDSVDIVGKRVDGGVDLVIMVSSRLCNTSAHRGLLLRKIDTYVEALTSDEFRAEFPSNAVRILVKCVVPPDPTVLAWIETLGPSVSERGAELRVEKAACAD